MPGNSHDRDVQDRGSADAAPQRAEQQPPPDDRIADDEHQGDERPRRAPASDVEMRERMRRSRHDAQPAMPFRNSAISAAVTVTTTSVLFGPPLASRSGLTPRDPADDTVCVAGLLAAERAAGRPAELAAARAGWLPASARAPARRRDLRDLIDRHGLNLIDCVIPRGDRSPRRVSLRGGDDLRQCRRAAPWFRDATRRCRCDP